MERNNEILVGVDGSDAGAAALAWAADEARLRTCGLAIVHARDPQPYGLWTTTLLHDRLPEVTQGIVDTAVTAATERQPSVPVRGKVLVAAPGRALIALSGRMQVTVVGRSGALSGLLPGSVTTRVLANAHSPVVAVNRSSSPAASRSPRRIVAAIRDPAQARPTIRFALEEASRHRATLVIVQVSSDPASAADGGRELDRGLARFTAEFPHVGLVCTVVVDSVAEGIASTCTPADLLILGHRRHRAFLANSLGSVAVSIVDAAPCPVAVVHEWKDAHELTTWETAPPPTPCTDRWTDRRNRIVAPRRTDAVTRKS